MYCLRATALRNVENAERAMHSALNLKRHFRFTPSDQKVIAERTAELKSLIVEAKEHPPTDGQDTDGQDSRPRRPPPTPPPT